MMASSLKSFVPALASKPCFHKAVEKLLEKTDEPCKPVNYRGISHLQSSKYIFFHEEEQHLADHLAFLAQSSPDPFCVSAVTIEESRTPPSLCFRVAANKTPAIITISRLRDCLKTVEEFAKTGTNQNDYETTLLTQVIELSKVCLHSRVNSRHANEAKRSCRKNKRPLHARVQSLQDSLDTQSFKLKDSIQPLLIKFPHLIQALKDIDEGRDPEQTVLLRALILSSHALSTVTGSPSLEYYLNSRGIGAEISQHGTVLEIDKISRYFDVCTYLLHLCRQPKYRPLFCNLALESLTAPPASHPDGATSRHYVHGEIQLILYYEQHPRDPIPRCIGSSKSACFLCDLFIRKHGGFQISHSHQRLYKQWTVPEEPWMTKTHTEKLNMILEDMRCEILDLANMWKRRAKGESNGAESRVHLLVLPECAESSTMSLAKLSDTEPRHLHLVNATPTKVENEDPPTFAQISDSIFHSNTRQTAPTKLDFKVQEESTTRFPPSPNLRKA